MEKDSLGHLPSTNRRPIQAISRIRLWWRWIVLNRLVSRFIISLVALCGIFALTGNDLGQTKAFVSERWDRMIDKLDPLPSPVDPSVYSPIYPEHPDPRLVEIADAMTELYRLFIEMRYLPAERVSFAPHETNPINLTEIARYGFTKDVVDLLQMMPYVHDGQPEAAWNFGSDAGEFLFGGEFYDLRGDDVDVYQCLVDPMYALGDCPYDSTDPACPKSWHEEDGYYIRPYYAVLNGIGNHGSAMVVNTKNYHIWVIDQLAGAGTSTDPVFDGGRQLRDEEIKNRNDLSPSPSRPAVEFLRDMITRFKTLEYIPGGLYGEDRDYEFDLYKDLYLSCGWPDNFNGGKFDILRERLENTEHQRWEAEEPLRRLEPLHAEVERIRRDTKKIERLKLMLNLPLEQDQRQDLEDQLRRLQQTTYKSEQFSKSQERDREQLREVEDILASPQEDDEIERFTKVRQALLTRLGDEDYPSRQERLYQEAKEEADKVDPRVRSSYEEHVKKYGW